MKRLLPGIPTSRRRGAVVVLVAICLIVLMSVLALTVDGGRMYAARRHAQVAADAAADAGARELYTSMADGNADIALARAAALSMAGVNGYSNGLENCNVTINIPPASGNRTGQSGYVEVIVEKKIPASFAGIFGLKAPSIRSRSVAAGTQVSTVGSVLVLDPKKKHVLTLKGRDSLISATGDIIVNSKSKKAVKVDKNGQAEAENFLIAGGIEKKSRTSMHGTISTGVVPTPDPLEGLPKPTKGPVLDQEDYGQQLDHDSFKYNLPPGTYKDLHFDHNDVVVMQPGIFYVDGGKMEVKGKATLQAERVMIYSTGKKEMKFDTRGTITLTPPVSGPYQDISLFQDPASKKKISFKKSGELDIQGIVYAPNSEVKFNHVDGVIGEDDDDDDEGDEEEDEEDDLEFDDGVELPMMEGSVNASFIVRKLKIDKHSHIQILGTGISAMRPFRGVVE